MMISLNILCREGDMVPGKFRITNQRQVILEELQSVKTHPTADELYALVRQRMPRISLATVYRNLEWMAANGLVQKIEVGGRQKRYDGTTAEHAHIRCIACGRVADVALSRHHHEAADYCIVDACGYKVLGCQLEFRGLCPACQEHTPARQAAAS